MRERTSLKIIHNLGKCSQKMSSSPITGQKSLKNISFGVAPNYQIAGVVCMSWASPEQHEGIKPLIVSHDTKEMEVKKCVVMATYLTF
jgi:hypothetical protein